MDEVSHKRCTKCGEVKSLDEFYAHDGMKDGRRPDCKLCVRKRNGAHYREKHPKIEPVLSGTYVAVHLWLLAHFAKTGICEQCGRSRKTHHALIHGRPYDRNRDNYRELCTRCHMQYDHGGERCYAAKLTPAQAAEIRQRRAAGEMYEDLATRFGVSKSAVWKVVTGRSWKLEAP